MPKKSKTLCVDDLRHAEYYGCLLYTSKQYFPETYTKDQMEEIIFMLLASWAEREGKE